MGKKKRKDLIDEKENLTNTDVVGFGEMAIQQEWIGAKLELFEEKW